MKGQWDPDACDCCIDRVSGLNRVGVDWLRDANDATRISDYKKRESVDGEAIEVRAGDDERRRLIEQKARVGGIEAIAAQRFVEEGLFVQQAVEISLVTGHGEDCVGEGGPCAHIGRTSQETAAVQ